MLSGYRQETDALGAREIPADALYGIAAMRAAERCAPSGRTLHPALVRALGAVELACARANMDAGVFSEKKFAAVEGACIEIIAGRLDAHVIVDAAMCDGGDAAVANISEIAANRAIVLLGGCPGDYDVVSPRGDLMMGRTGRAAYHAACVTSIVSSVRGVASEVARVADVLHESASRNGGAGGVGREASALAAVFSNCRLALSGAADACLETPVLFAVSDDESGADRMFRRRAAAHLKDITGLKYSVDDEVRSSPTVVPVDRIVETLGKCCGGVLACSEFAGDECGAARESAAPSAMLAAGFVETLKTAGRVEWSAGAELPLVCDAVINAAVLLGGACAVLRGAFSI